VSEIYPDSFRIFWETFPRRQGKRHAFLAWQKATERAAPEEILAGAEGLAAEVSAGRDLKYVKMPATWLNSDGWLDEPEPKSRPVLSKTAALEAAMKANLEKHND
jgi:hypothetical protein